MAFDESASVAMAWPARLEEDEAGRFLVRFRDFPEALTDGATRAEALAQARDCLAEAVAGRIVRGEDIPLPIAAEPGEDAVTLEAMLALKTLLYLAMRARRLRKIDLARALGVDEKEVRRMMDPAHRGVRLPRLEAALAACGLEVEVSARPMPQSALAPVEIRAVS